MSSSGVCSDTMEVPYQEMQANLDCGDSNSADDDDSSLDPRIKVELDILNQASMDINRLENELDEARSKYRSTFAASSQRMEELGVKIRKNIQRARHYFDLTEKAKEAQSEAVRAARQYQTASSVYRAAKETIALAELRLMDEESHSASLSSAWQEMLNHATVRVMEAEREKTRSETEHHKRAAVFADIEAQLHRLETKYKRSIAKSRPYFETKAELELKLQQLKQNVSDLQQAISTRKSRYGEALRRLETISEEIHECRRNKLLLRFPREPGVGAESDSVGTSVSDINIEKGLFPPCSPISDSCFNDEEDEKSDVTEGDDVRRLSSVDETASTDHAGSHRRQASCDSNDSSDSSTSEGASSSSSGQTDSGICFLAPNSRGESAPHSTAEPAKDTKGDNCAATGRKGEQFCGEQGIEKENSLELCLKTCSLSDSGLCKNSNLRLAGDGSSSSELCAEGGGSAHTVVDAVSTSTLVSAVSSHCRTSDAQVSPEASVCVSTGSGQQKSDPLTPAGEQTLSSGSDCKSTVPLGHCDLTCNNSTPTAAAGLTCVTPEAESKGQSNERSKRSLRKGVMLLNPSRLATSSFWKLH